MTKMENYWCDNTPSSEEINEAIKLAKENKCFIILNWYKNYSGSYSVSIGEEDTLESVQDRLPKRYPV